MGGSGSKQTQLDKFGQLLSSQEKEALNNCFLAIAGAQEAEAFGEEKLQVHTTYDCGPANHVNFWLHELARRHGVHGCRDPYSSLQFQKKGWSRKFLTVGRSGHTTCAS